MNSETIQKNWRPIAAAVVIILAWKPISKIFKGFGSAAGFVGDVLSIPGNIVDYLSNMSDKAFEATIENAFDELCRTTIYDNSNPDHRKALENLRKLAKVNPSFFTPLIKIWQEDKDVLLTVFGVKYYKPSTTGKPGNIGYLIGKSAQKRQLQIGLVAIVAIILLFTLKPKK